MKPIEEIKITKRICNLQKGEVFMMNNCLFVVSEKSDGIYYKYNSESHTKTKAYRFGLNNQAKVEIISPSANPFHNPM